MREAVLSLTDAELDTLGLEELVGQCRRAGIREFEEFACYGHGAVVMVAVEESLDSEALRDLEYVDRVERVHTTEATNRYFIAFSSPALSGAIAGHANDLLGTCDPELDGSGVTMSFVGPQGAISGTVEEYETAGLSPTLEQLGEYTGRSDPLDSLTDRQEEVLRTAYEMGFYEVPRAVSTREVATALNLDPSTVAEHIQRAERNLLGRHLAPE